MAAPADARAAAETDSEDPAQAQAPASADVVPRWADDAPAPMDAPQLRNVEPRTRLYVDGSFAQTPDLSALPYIAGKGRNLRLAFGGSKKWRRFQFDVELPASQATTLDLLDPNPTIQVADADRHQTSLSIGDLRLGAQWTQALPAEALALVGGFSLRARIPTHTTRFQFHNLLDNGNLNLYVLPYYFHIEPALLFGAAAGPVSFVMNQGAMILIGPDGSVGNLAFVVPTIYFWDAHYALACRIIELLSVSVEVNTTIQLNELDPVMFPKLSHLKAVSVSPDLQVHLGRYRVDAAARFGLTRGADVIGVLGYGGTNSYLLRLSRVFD